MELLYWLQDVAQHWRVAQERQALRQPGRGIDHTRGENVQAIVARIHPRRMTLRVVEIIQATPTTKTFRLERTDGPLPPFRAGQYVNVFVDVDGVLTSRPYSIASPPGSDLLELTVRNKPGGFVAPYLLNEIKVGDEIATTGPAGNFYYEPLIDGDDLVFLAGGSGITPFMSLIRDLLATRPGQVGQPALKMHLLYGSRTPDDVIYGDELTQLAARHANFHYTLVISEPPPGYNGPTGLLDAPRIREQVGDVTGKTFYICGPNVMYDFCLAALDELGVPRYKVRRELYGPPADVTKEPGWPAGVTATTLFQVEVIGHKVIPAPAGEPLLNTLERHGIVVPALCRSGACSACRTRLLSGRVFSVFSGSMVGLRESDRQHGYIHACVTYPLSDLRIRL